MPLQRKPRILLRTIKACLRNAGSYAATTCRPTLGVNLGFAVTHVFINRQAAAILQNDGWKAQADFIKRSLLYLNAGVCRADGGLGCMSHYYNPSTGQRAVGRHFGGGCLQPFLQLGGTVLASGRCQPRPVPDRAGQPPGAGCLRAPARPRAGRRRARQLRTLGAAGAGALSGIRRRSLPGQRPRPCGMGDRQQPDSLRLPESGVQTGLFRRVRAGHHRTAGSRPAQHSGVLDLLPGKSRSNCTGLCSPGQGRIGEYLKLDDEEVRDERVTILRSVLLGLVT